MILVVGLFVHFWAMHFAIERPVTFEKVQNRLLSPGWVFFDVILLIAVIYHAFNGLYNVISDYNPRPVIKKIIAWVLFFGGTILVIYGILALLPFTRQGGV
ncbi:MAG: succinate dehydrogenase / fumarate reductase, rane anchor subunit [Candidatus Marinimicrobia bacterium]|nr:succinate dehydrogenase / fumarate reductase, rane anchor subunit [Candidatus Neomarinimicrobiota bacterium]